MVEALEIHQHIARSVPDLIGKVARTFDTLPIKTHVVARRIACDEHEAKCICAVLFDDFDRVDAVAKRLAHLAPLTVADETVNEYMMEGNILAKCEPHHDHAGDPKENDVVARNERRCRVELLQIRCLIRPAKRFKRPKPRTEPGVKNIFILMNVRAVAMRARSKIRARDARLAAIITVPCRNAMSPPKLTRDAPVTDVFQPILIDLCKAVWHKLDAAIFHRCNRRLCKALHLDKPLL